VTADDLAQIESIIRRVIREERMTHSAGPSTPICGELTLQQRFEAADAHYAAKVARRNERKAAKEAAKGRNSSAVKTVAGSEAKTAS
jgi:hypothetical protein